MFLLSKLKIKLQNLPQLMMILKTAQRAYHQQSTKLVGNSLRTLSFVVNVRHHADYDLCGIGIKSQPNATLNVSYQFVDNEIQSSTKFTERYTDSFYKNSLMFKALEVIINSNGRIIFCNGIYKQNTPKNSQFRPALYNTKFL